MIEEITTLINENAKTVADEALSAYLTEHSDAKINDELRTKIMQNCVSQISIQLCNFVHSEDNDIKEEFDQWFADNERSSLRRMCDRLLNEEYKRFQESKKPNVSFLEKFRHGQLEKEDLI